jgi:hypothetical protein
VTISLHVLLDYCTTITYYLANQNLEMTSNVPKFTSFRPKPKAIPEPPKEAPTPPEPKTVTKTSKSKSSSHRTESRAPEKRKSERDAPASKDFFSDRRGDPDILRYGTLNTSEIPAYRRAGYGCVLGLDPNLKIDRERSSQTKIYITPAKGRRQERLLTGKRAAYEDRRTLRFINSNETRASEEVLDFIPVSNSHKRKHDNSEDEENPDTEFDYRGITRDSSQPLDPDTQYDSGNEVSTTGSEITKKNTALVRKTREFPEDIQAWIDFIEHQEAMLSLDTPTVALTDASKRQLADVRIPIYEEALKKVGSAPDNQVLLYIGLLREARKSWNEAKLISRWKDVLQKYPGNGQLWLMFLDLVQSSFGGFKYEGCRATYLECLQALRTASKNVDLELILHVFIRATSMMQAAGYQELAIAIWQAVLERSLGGATAGVTSERDLELFESFWETEVPRIGEDGAYGWREILPDDRDSLPPSTPLLSRNQADSDFEDFQKRETELISRMRYPGHTEDENADDDAFHTVFYVDIEEYLKILSADASITLVLEAFLCFCGLPPLPRPAEHQRTWWNDPFLSHIAVRSMDSENAQSEEMDPFAQKVQRYLACNSQSMQMTSDLLFDQDFALDGVRLDTDFVRRILNLIAEDVGNDDIIGEYLLAFELRHYPLEVFKTAKTLLKNRPTSQRLYHAYGLVESRRGKSEKANQVFSMALSMGDTGSHETLHLLSSWVWEALRAGDQYDALWRLTSPRGKLPVLSHRAQYPDSTRVNAASATLSEACEKALLRNDYPSAVIGTSLLALLDYLHNTSDPSLALAAHQRLTSYFDSHTLPASPYSELNAQATARFLIYHVTHTPIVKPALLRTAIEPLITLFPNNTILLSLYAANEARFAIDDRVRSVMHQSALHSSDATSVSGWAFAIRFEELRGEIAATAHSVRAVYKRATHADSSGAHSPVLWTSYLRFELKQLELERAKTRDRRPGKDGKKRSWESRLEEAENRVKETFYEALRRMPWCKDYMMLAFTEVRRVFGEEDLAKVYGVMMEKEIRVYVEVE